MRSIKEVLLARILAEKPRREERVQKLREALEAAYERAPGPAYCVRRLEVVEHVARALGIRVLNNAVFFDVTETARALGWDLIRNGNRALFRGVKRKDMDADEALATSRANRYDPRSGRGSASGFDDAAYVTG